METLKDITKKMLAVKDQLEALDKREQEIEQAIRQRLEDPILREETEQEIRRRLKDETLSPEVKKDLESLLEHH